MAQPREESVYRRVVELTGQARLDDELGAFGHGVGPRFDAQTGQSRMRVRGQEGEDWCLRRLLIGLVASNRLRMPASLQVTDEAHASKHALPDAVLVQPDQAALGIEVTAATSEAHQRQLTEADRQAAEGDGNLVYLASADGYTGDAPERQALSEIDAAYRRKLKKLRDARYRDSGQVDLLVYLNSAVDILVGPGDMAARIRADGPPDDGERQFRQLHVLIGDTLILDALGNTRELVSLRGRYEHDFNQWCFDQAQAAGEGQTDQLDLDNIAEELRSLGASDRRALRSQLERLLEHLLKWTYQPEKRTRSWLRSINDARRKIARILDDSPSLGREDILDKLIADAYANAIGDVEVETGLARETFPESCAFTKAQIFSEEFPPEDERREVTD
jgi:hypothetical protein